MSIKDEECRDVNSPQKYSEVFKRQVVAEFESGKSSKASLKRKYGIAGHSTIDKWLRKYGKFEYPKNLSIGRPLKDIQKQKDKELIASVRKREKELEKELALKDAELLAYKRFIEIAERELNIRIVKKSGTKQSRK